MKEENKTHTGEDGSGYLGGKVVLEGLGGKVLFLLCRFFGEDCFCLKAN